MNADAETKNRPMLFVDVISDEQPVISNIKQKSLSFSAIDTVRQNSVHEDTAEVGSCESADEMSEEWSDVESEQEDNSEQSFQLFVRNHSSQDLFDLDKRNPRKPLPRNILAKLKRSATSSAEVSPEHTSKFLTSTPESDMDIGLCITTPPISPSRTPIARMSPLKSSVPKDVVIRSKSLENHHRRKADKYHLHPLNDGKDFIKKKLFRSSNALNKLQGTELRKGSSVVEGVLNDRKYRTKSPVLKLFKRSGSKGHTSADEDFVFKSSNNEKTNIDGPSKSNGAPPTFANGALSAGSLLSETSIQPTITYPVGAFNPEMVASYDSVDGSPGPIDMQRIRQNAENLKQKIIKTSEAITLEQATKDDNVAEYLKLTNNADKQQASRIKLVFEKKNQKSNANIAQLQKKLDGYHRRLRELENNGSGKGRLRDVGANIREFSGGVVDSMKGGLSGLHHATQNAAGAIVNKPKDFASKFKNKFGSADNLSSLKDEDEPQEEIHQRFGSADDVSSASGSVDNIPSIGSNMVSALDESTNVGRSSITSAPDSPSSGVGRRLENQHFQMLNEQLVAMKTDLQEIKQSQIRVENESESCKSLMRDEHSILSNALQEERDKCERLEVQLNDLTELHQREIAILKQELTSMEEKVEYHAHERARDMQEALENCQTRIAKMELQQQQLVSVEGLENATARALMGKLINLLLSVMAVLLVLVSTVSSLVMPLMRSRVRIISTIIGIVAFVIAYKNWDVLEGWFSLWR